MRFGALICTTLLSLGIVNSATAANRTTRLGAMDSVADAAFLRMLDSKNAEESGTSFALRGVWFAESQASLAMVPYASSRSQESRTSEIGMMLLLGAALIAFHVRRRQKALPYRPLADVLYR